MRKPTLEERVSLLESELKSLKDQNGNGSAHRDWRRTVGAFAGDEFMRQVGAAALEIREKDRKKARRERTKSRRSS